MRGQVVDAEENPLPGASVALVPVLSRAAARELRLQGKTPEPAARAVSGNDGRFELAAPASGMWEVQVTARGFEPLEVALIPLLEPRELSFLYMVAEEVPDRPDRPADLPAAVPAGEPVQVSGRVLDDRTQAPIPGALVWPAADPGAFVRTDAKGIYTLPWTGGGDDDGDDDDDDDGGWSAGAAGYLAAVEQPRTGAAGPTFLLEASMTLPGVVVDPQDRPIPGVAIQAMVVLAAEPFTAQQEEAVTDAGGAFAIPGLPPGRTVTLSLSRKGYMPARLDIAMPGEMPAAEPVRVVLRPGSRLAGRVVDEERRPVTGARVRLFRLGTQSTVITGSTGSRLPAADDETETAAGGAFAVEPVEPGRLRLTATAAGFLTAEIRAVDLPPGKTVEGLELVLRRGAVVTGRVLGADGEPVEHALVGPVEDSTLRIERDSTDGKGTYRLEGVPEGVQSFVVTGRGVQRTVQELEVRPGENRLDFRVDAGHVVAGRVLDATGKPLASAAVGLVMPGDVVQWDRTASSTYAGAGGSFRFEGVETGVYDLHAEAAGHAPARLEALEVTGSVDGLELRLETGVAVHGRLLGLTPEGLVSARVAAFPASPETVRTLTAGEVDIQGGYRIDSLAPGDWTVMAGTSTGAQVRRRVTLPAGADVALDLELGGLTLTGRVLRGGQPVRDAHVAAELLESGAWLGSGFTDVQGAFRLPHLTPGAYRLRITSPRGGGHEQLLELTGDRDVVVDVAGQRVTGQVVDAADHSPLDQAAVFLQPTEELSPSGSPALWTRSDETGAFTLTDIAPGTYRLGAQAEGYAPSAITGITVEVGAGDGVDGVRLALEKAEGLVLEVLGPLGRSPAVVDVALVDGAGRTVLAGSHSTGENGRVRIASAPKGSWRLVVSAAGCATSEQSVEVPGPPVRLALPRAATLTVAAPGLTRWATVTVTGEDGLPFRSVERGRVLQERRLNDGQALIRDLPEGRWQVRVTAPDGRTWQEEVTTAVGRPAQMRILQ